MTTQALPRTEFDPNSWPCPHSGCGVVTSGGAAAIAEHLDWHVKTRADALRSVSTLASAVREVIDGDDEQARADLSALSLDEIAAVLPAVTRVLGLLASIEAARAAKR